MLLETWSQTSSDILCIETETVTAKLYRKMVTGSLTTRLKVDFLAKQPEVLLRPPEKAILLFKFLVFKSFDFYQPSTLLLTESYLQKTPRRLNRPVNKC